MPTTQEAQTFSVTGHLTRQVVRLVSVQGALKGPASGRFYLALTGQDKGEATQAFTDHSHDDDVTSS